MLIVRRKVINNNSDNDDENNKFSLTFFIEFPTQSFSQRHSKAFSECTDSTETLPFWNGLEEQDD